MSCRWRERPLALAAATVGAIALTLGAGTAAPAGAPAFPQGATSFQSNCAMCHGTAGAGVPGLAPPITSYPARYAGSAEGRRQLALTLLYGLYGDIVIDDKHFDLRMPDFARLDDATLAATLNFVVFELGHAPAGVKPLEAAEIGAERGKSADGAAVREHRKGLVP
jgi:mono/diheme cytochrome c family protein